MKKNALILFLIPVIAYALLTPGSYIPYFKISDGTGKVLTRNSLRGRIIIGFYNDRSASKKNIAFEKELNKMKYKAGRKKTSRVLRLAVTDATSANAFTKYFWKKNLRKISRQRGIRIYGDWNGSFKKALRIPPKESTFFIIDSRMKLLYIYSGKIPYSHYKKIKRLIKGLSQ
jgi:peroxiredoxin